MTDDRRFAVFLDRDGVLIDSVLREGVPRPPDTLADMVVLPGVEEACLCLREAGYVNVIVTNQPDVARGKTSATAVNEINAMLLRQLAIDDVYVCPHDDGDRCGCRKPAPGLLQAAATDYGLELGRSFIVGDRWRDVEAGRAAGCQTVFVDRSYPGEPVPNADIVVVNLLEAAKWILTVGGPRAGSCRGRRREPG